MRERIRRSRTDIFGSEFEYPDVWSDPDLQKLFTTTKGSNSGTNPTTTEGEKSNTRHTGAIAWDVVGGVLIIVLIGLSAWVFRRRRRQSRRTPVKNRTSARLHEVAELENTDNTVEFSELEASNKIPAVELDSRPITTKSWI